MSDEYPYIEQDYSVPGDGNNLPTYDDLTVQSGPNSRFGRWRGWIEKRAAERYMDITPEERARRRERGWGNLDTGPENGEQSNPIPLIVNEPPTPGPVHLYIQTNIDPNASTSSAYDVLPPLSSPLPPLPFVSQKLWPSHLKLNQFGSRFLPHTTSPIRCLLPLLSDRMLLIGHDEGLSVLDMFPQEWTEIGVLARKGPDEAETRRIWEGECVYQMTILESESTGEGTPQGVVLALVGPHPDSSPTKDQESLRTLRMYNLASLTSLAKWAIGQKGSRPLDLRRPPNWNLQQSPAKKHRSQNSLTRGIKSLIDSPSSTHSTEPHTSSYHNLLYPSASNAATGPRGPSPSTSGRSTPSRGHSDESSWDLVDDLPLRWATDFVPLASTGSRLENSSIITYALWQDDQRKGKGGQLLAVATKYNILLYESPKGERAFRFIKEFYTPLHPRNMTFFQQSVQDIGRSSSSGGIATPSRNHSHFRSESTGGSMRASSSSNAAYNYGPQLSLFVIFDKRAGWIRIADSAVGEIDVIHNEAALGPVHSQQLPTSPSLSRRPRPSFEVTHPGAGKWIPPVQCELPLPPSNNHAPSSKNVYLLTRGKYTYIMPYPLPANTAACAPLRVVVWKATPASVTPRVGGAPSPSLQLVGLGEQGVEVLEIPLSFLSKGKGKAKAADTLLRADEDMGPTGFLCNGGHWDHPNYPFHPPPLSRSYSTSSDASANSFDSLETEEVLSRLKLQQGLYGWCRKGLGDYRVFWVGGSLTDEVDDTDLDSET